jgi:hypothetical protein
MAGWSEFPIVVSPSKDAEFDRMKTVALLLALVPNLLALDIATLDGRSFPDCQVSKVYPDSICVLFSGGGARIKFTNLPEQTRAQFGYDPELAAAFEKAEAARIAREQATLAAQRMQLAAQRRAPAAAGNGNGSGSPQLPPPGSNTGAQYVGANLAGPSVGAYNQYQGANQFGNRYAGAQYVGVNMAGPGGIRGVTYGPVPPRPGGNFLP